MHIDETTSREDLEFAIIENDDLYRSLDEQRFLDGGYTTEELREAVTAWIAADDGVRILLNLPLPGRSAARSAMEHS